MGMDFNTRAEGIKQIFREKARIFRKKIVTFSSPLEKAALAWKEKKEAEEKEGRKKTLKKEESSELSFREATVKDTADHDTQKLAEITEAPKENSEQSQETPSSDEAEWIQYKPWKEEEKEKETKKEISLNPATVRALAKRLISGEWARMLGRKIEPPQFHTLEGEAALWKEKKEEKKRKKEEARRERLRQRRIKAAIRRERRLARKLKREETHRELIRRKEILTETLEAFSRKLERKTNPADPHTTLQAFEGAFAGVGQVLDISQQEGTSTIWFEFRKDAEARMAKGESLPCVYKAKITDNVEIISFQRISDKKERERLRRKFLIKSLRCSLEGISFNIYDEARAKEKLEEKLSELGRVIDIKRKETGWVATVELWGEMKIRNTIRGGKPPIVTDEIGIDWKDGKLEFATEEDEGDNIEEGEEDNAMSLRGGLEGRRSLPAGRQAIPSHEIASAPAVPRNDEIQKGGTQNERD